MKKQKANILIEVVKFGKIVTLLIAILSGLLSWMFLVSQSTTMASLDHTSVAIRYGLNTIGDISSNLAGISISFSAISAALAFVYYLISKNNDKNASKKFIHFIFFAFLIIILLYMRDYILRTLIANS